MSDDRAFIDELRALYVVEREIGRGGMATVYLAHEVHHRRPVALKVLRGERTAELAPERFLREIETAARLQHPHIMPVFDSGESAGRLWFTMPYVDGESLRERLSRTPPLSVADAVRIAREAAQALEYAHRQGVIHRDIKPENILLTRDGSTLVADFGIARSAGSGSDRITSAGAVMGTPSYMSPEQAGADAEVDGRSDIYSLGCVLYEMVAGRPPFTGATPHAVVARHMTEPPPPLRTAGRRVSPPLERAILKAMAKARGDRFDSAAEFASALERPGVVVPERARARPMAIVLGVVAVVAAIASGSLLLRQRDAAVRAAGGTAASGFDRKLTQITTGAGVEEWPAWSPDGTRLAYVAEVDGFRQLFVRTLASGEERRVTRGAHDDIQPAWSPDGTRLVFVRATADSGKLAPSDLNGWYFEGGDVWSVDLGSGREAPLVSNAFGPAWSPDGARLAFDASWAGPRRIWISDSTGRNPRQLTSDSSEAVIHAGPRWSPDGRRLVFRRIDKTDSDIMTAEVASDATTRVTHDASTDLDPAWSPDGRCDLFLIEPRRRNQCLAHRGRRGRPGRRAASAAHHRRGRRRRAGARARRPPARVRGARSQCRSLAAAGVAGDGRRHRPAGTGGGLDPRGEPRRLVAGRAHDRVQFGPPGRDEHLAARPREVAPTAGSRAGRVATTSRPGHPTAGRWRSSRRAPETATSGRSRSPMGACAD